MPKLNIKDPYAYVVSAAREYRLDAQTVVAEMERGFSDALSYVTGYNVEAWLNFSPNELDIQLFAYLGRAYGQEDELKVKEFTLESIKPNTVKLINSRIRQRMDVKTALRDWKALVPMIQEAYEGRIVDHPEKGRPLSVELYKERYGVVEHVHAWCHPCDQPPHERAVYKLGQSRMWVVKAVGFDPALRGGGRQVEISLSRNSMALPQVLMRRACLDRIPLRNIRDIVCVERLPGSHSYMTTSYNLPPAAIARTAEEISEKVRVFNAEMYKRTMAKSRNENRRMNSDGLGNTKELYLEQRRATAR